MVTTTWTGGAGDWNTASNWTNGVPTAADDAVFPSDHAGPVSGDGPAASLTVEKEQATPGVLGGRGTTVLYSLTGTHALATLDVTAGAVLSLGQEVPATLSFGSALVSGTITLQHGSRLGSGTITLANGSIDLSSSIDAVPITLSNPIVLAGAAGQTGSDTIRGEGAAQVQDATVATVSGVISGSGMLTLFGPTAGNGRLVLANGANSYSGGTEVGGTVEVTAPGSLGSGPVLLAQGTLTLDQGVTAGPVSGIGQLATVDASLTVFADDGLLFINGSGSSTYVGTTSYSHVYDPYPPMPDQAGFSEVFGGTGHVTVFAGNGGGTFYGCTGGRNVIVAGADLTGYTEFPGPPLERFPGLRHFMDAQGTIYTPAASTIGGGGDGDLLVATGTLNNLVAAAGGNETLTGSGARGNNTFFGGTGSDLIVTGAGQDLVVAGSGAATIAGGAGNAAIFAGSGQDLIVGGTGGGYIQAGSGSAIVFTGQGADLIAVVSGQAGGSVTVSGFRVGTDFLAARGYASGPTQTVVGGNTVLSFSDHTQVTLLGVASLPASAFS